MYADAITLEITRDCDLCCEHCCRGEKEKVDMSLNTIDNVFKDIKHVGKIFLTGGEPLMAVNELEYLAYLINFGIISVDKVVIITNATVMSSRVLNALKTLNKSVDLDIRLSSDMFHVLELERFGMLDIRNKNIRLLKDLFGMKTHTSTKAKNSDVMYANLMNAGRAKNLTQERLDEINSMSDITYRVLENYVGVYEEVSVKGDYILGNLYVNVYGYLSNFYWPEFEREDEVAMQHNINVNDIPIRDAAIKFCEFLFKYKSGLVSSPKKKVVRNIFDKIRRG